MKTKTKALALTLCAVLLVVTTVFVTMAYLTSQDTVTNTFTVGNVAITLDEAKVDTAGNAVTPAARVDANVYKLIPGRNYTKDPTVHVASTSEECWLFVKVENGLAGAEATGSNTIANQMTANGWTPVSGTTDIYAYKDRCANGADVPVFQSFTIAGTANVSDFINAKIVVTAYAIQADGFDTAVAAWSAAGSSFTTN